MPPDSIRPFYDRWPQYNQRLRDVIAAMTDEQLAIHPDRSDGWPIWATVGHTAGMRVYWLCEVVGEPGVERTPFTVPLTEGWEDDLSHPRGASELAEALDSTFTLIDGVLDRWTPDMLATEVRREYGGATSVHSLGSILQRMFSHDAYHCGELSQTLGIHGLRQIDLWSAQ